VWVITVHACPVSNDDVLQVIPTDLQQTATAAALEFLGITTIQKAPPETMDVQAPALNPFTHALVVSC